MTDVLTIHRRRTAGVPKAPARSRQRSDAPGLGGAADGRRPGRQGPHAAPWCWRWSWSRCGSSWSPASPPRAPINRAGGLVIWPDGLTFAAYQPDARPTRPCAPRCWSAWASPAVGTAVSMVVSVLCAYGLSRSRSFGHRLPADAAGRHDVRQRRPDPDLPGRHRPRRLRPVLGADPAQRGLRLQHPGAALLLLRHRRRPDRRGPPRRGGRLAHPVVDRAAHLARRDRGDRALLRGRLLELLLQRHALHADGQREVAAAVRAAHRTSTGGTGMPGSLNARLRHAGTRRPRRCRCRWPWWS